MPNLGREPLHVIVAEGFVEEVEHFRVTEVLAGGRHEAFPRVARAAAGREVERHCESRESWMKEKV